MAEALANWLSSAFSTAKKKKQKKRKRYERDHRTGRRGSLPYQYGCEDLETCRRKQAAKAARKRTKGEEEDDLEPEQTIPKEKEQDKDSGHDNDSSSDSSSDSDSDDDDIARQESVRRRAFVERILGRTSKRLSSKSRKMDDDDSLHDSWERFILRRNSEDDGPVNYDDVFRLQLQMYRAWHRDPSEEGYGFLNRRAFSESDLFIQASDDSNERDSVLDRYGLMMDSDEDAFPCRGTICIPDGVVVGPYECKLQPEFFEQLAQQSEAVPEDGSSLQVALEKKTSEPVTRAVRPIELAPKSSDPTLSTRSRSRSPPEDKDEKSESTPIRPKRVVSLAFGGLRKSIALALKNKKDSMDEDEWDVFRPGGNRRSDRTSQDSGSTSGTTTNNGSAATRSSATGLPDDLASCLSPTGSGPPQEFDEAAVERSSRLQLDSPMWSRFGLFEDEEYSSWSRKYRTNNLPLREVLRQDKMFELIMTEKRHCANLVFLKQAYRTRFLEDCEEISLTPSDVDTLIPDVLDAMLLFHLNLLDRLMQRQKETEQVTTIADIIVKELTETGEHLSCVVNAYTTFGVQKEECEKRFDDLKKDKALFRKYLENLMESDPRYRKYDRFKTLLTKVMAHSTRYHLILEDVRKNDLEESRKEDNVAAVNAAKSFAMRIDHALQVSQLTRNWESLRTQIDWNSKTRIATDDASAPLVDFYMTDLSSENSRANERKIKGFGFVVVKPIGEKVNGDSNCLLILFDDVLVFLQKKPQKLYTFYPQEQAAFAVSTLYPRVIERGWSMHLMSSSFKPMLMEVQFRNKSDRAKWMDLFEKAIAKAPKQVRMGERPSNAQSAKEREKEEKKQREAEEAWLKKLETHFDERKDAESVVAEYVEKRMEWFDRLRECINGMPYKNRADIPEKVKAAVRQRFKEMRQARVEPISRLVSKCTSARDQDLVDFFDDAAEIQYARLQTENDINNLDSDSGSDTSEGKNLPRRVQTFHGTSAARRDKGSFRRHTTVPKMSVVSSASGRMSIARERMAKDAERVDEEEAEVDGSDAEIDAETAEQDEMARRREHDVAQMTHRLPLSMNLRARRAATQIIRENVALRSQVGDLKNELAMQKTRLSLYERSRCLPGGAPLPGPSVPAAETHEALRRKEQELRDEETRLHQKKDDFKEIEERLRKSEDDLQKRWAVLMERETILGGNVVVNGERKTSTQTVNSRPQAARDSSDLLPLHKKEPSNGPIISPALKSLAETKTKKKK